MRLWTLHPKLLDTKGLVALWRESLLAQKVLQGQTIGYKNHPQLSRFRLADNPLGSLATYLRTIKAEADTRSYNFDSSKIVNRYTKKKINVSSGQIEFELNHLQQKLKTRDPAKLREICIPSKCEINPLFVIVPGPIEPWEIINERHN